MTTNEMEDIGRSAPLAVLGACGFVCDVVIRGEAITIWNLMGGALALLLLLICSGNATDLLRDKHADTTYIFNSDANDVRSRITQNEAVLIVDEWATRFYGDALFQFAKCQFKTKPIRHWLVTFQKAETGQRNFAAILPDGQVVMPNVERGI